MSKGRAETENGTQAGPPPIIEGGWRTATEELPEEEQKVLVATTFVGSPFSQCRQQLRAQHVGAGAFDSPETEWPVTVDPENGEDVYYRVTHWCPLPTLPERLGEMPERGRENKTGSKRLRRMEPDAPAKNGSP
jgi:hypothetical protein